MLDQDTKHTTPLQNLFYYIRDLFYTAEACYEFEKESNNNKKEYINFWKVENLLSLAKECKQKKISEYAFYFEDTNNEIDKFLRIKRIQIPPEPNIPSSLKDWITINRTSNIPTIEIKKQIEQIESFDSSTQRIKEFEKFQQISKNSLFELQIPSILDGWVNIIESKITKIKEKITIIQYTENEDRIKETKSFEKELNVYYAKFETAFKINKFYDALHTLYYELKGKDSKSLYISFGLINCIIGGVNYRNYLFHIPLRLSLKSQELTLETDTFTKQLFCEQYFVELLDEHFKKEHPTIVEQRKKDTLLAIDKFNSKFSEFFFSTEFIRSNYYNSALEILGIFSQQQDTFFIGENLNYAYDNSETSLSLKFSFSPIIQTKIVESQIAISQDANNIINKINELQSKGLLSQIPDFFKKLFRVEGEIDENINTNITKYPLGDKIITSINENETNLRSLFPLPYNEEQYEIVKRLNEQDAVTVKGPPGTGKSHTIANIISHFVAHGKSILVVSHNSKALRVLKDKLPKAIQNLAVSLVNEGKGYESLRASVNAIIGNLSQRYDESKEKELESQLTTLENKYAETLKEIYTLVHTNTKSLKLYNPINKVIEDKSAYDWAVYFFEKSNNELKYIKDKIHHESDTNELVNQLSLLNTIGNKLQPEDFELIDYQFLADENFPDLNDIRKFEIELQEISQNIEIENYKKIKPESITEEIKTQIEDFENNFNAFQTKKIANKVYTNTKYSDEILKTLLKQSENLRTQIKTADEYLLSYTLDLSALEDTDPDILHNQINQLIVKFDDNNKIGWLTKKTLDKNSKRFFECKVNFIQASKLEHLKIIETEIAKRKSLKQLNITFKNYLKIFSISELPDIQEILNELDFTLYFSENLNKFNYNLISINLPKISIISIDIQDRLHYFKNIKFYLNYSKIINSLKEIKKNLISQKKNHPLIHKIADAIEAVDRSAYDLYLTDYRIKRDKQNLSIEFEKIYAHLYNTIPITATSIKNLYNSGASFVLNKDECEVDIFISKIKYFLDSITNHTKGADKLLSSLQSIKTNIESLTVDIIRYKTWFNKSKKVDDLQKTALQAWLNDLINIGKGYTRNNIRDVAASIRNMQIAKGAVPIWIMPLSSAVTFFPDASPSQFDLLIIDEASQCDISSLNLVFRCKKSLIVGDENQTSVVANKSIFTIDRTNEMLDKYLISHRFKTQFDVNNKNNSIYTISGVIYPNIVTLTEHFRCLPEIIGYSNQYVYNSEIVPLKTATESPYGDPISIHYVEDNHVDEQKPLIVEKVIEIIENYIKDFQKGQLKSLPTIGIVTLDSSNTKHYTLLIRQISQNELIKRYADKLELLIGTSREFQGDERDIMFLTITASHSINEKNNFEIKPPRAAATEEFMRIFNVAASRAREKSILIHSIHPDAIGIMNPDCYRKKIIDYYTNCQYKSNNQDIINNLQSLLNKTDVNSGDFEKSVCKFLYNKGLGNYMFPQFEVGKYRIDFGIIKNNKKLAIECDGYAYHSGFEKIQEDINRQLILERAGWKFFRIQSTDWFYRNLNVSTDLINWIESFTGNT